MCEFSWQAIHLLCMGQGIFAVRNDRPLVGQASVEINPFLTVRFGVGLDCACRAFRFAHTAVNAVVGVDDQHGVTLVKTVYRADVHAVRVLTCDTVFGDNIGQDTFLHSASPMARRFVVFKVGWVSPRRSGFRRAAFSSWRRRAPLRPLLHVPQPQS